MIFFDGEEAFVEWSDTDSIYGAKHLAKRWDDEGTLKDMEVRCCLSCCCRYEIGTPNAIVRVSYT